MEEINAEIGNDGTDDDITMEVCSDLNVKECCTTKELDGVGGTDSIVQAISHFLIIFLH